MNILHLDSSILGSSSITRELSAVVVAGLRAQHQSAQVTYRDLVGDEIRHLTGPIAAGFRQIDVGAFDTNTAHEHRLSEVLVTEFLASDVIVIGAPMYNFSVPSQLKAWLDRVAQAGRTFRYTESGPVGLASGKRQAGNRSLCARRVLRGDTARAHGLSGRLSEGVLRFPGDHRRPVRTGGGGVERSNRPGPGHRTRQGVPDRDTRQLAHVRCANRPVTEVAYAVCHQARLRPSD